MEQPTTTIPPTTPSTTPKPATAPVLTPPKPPSLAAAVNRVQGVRMPVPKSLTLGNTRDLNKTGSYLHCCIYGDTDARKTTTAALFGTPENTRIIMTRRKEQLTGLRDLGYQYAEVTDESSLLYALQYPEQLWPDWASLPDRVLVLDDATEAIEQLLEGAEETLEAESKTGAVKDPRRTYREAGDNLRDVLKITLRKPQHFIVTALASVKEEHIRGGERIAPALPPSMMNLVTTEMEFVFYIDKLSWKFHTTSSRVQVQLNVDGKVKTFSREIFAKQKLPMGQKLQSNEPMDLRAIWNTVMAGKTAPVVPVKK